MSDSNATVSLQAAINTTCYMLTGTSGDAMGPAVTLRGRVLI